MFSVRLLTWRSIKTRPLRSILSMFGIVLGVGVLLAIQLTNNTALNSITRLFQDTSGKADLILAHGSDRKDGIPPELIAELERTPEVLSAVPSIQARTVLEGQIPESDIGLSFFGVDLGGLALYGIDPNQDQRVREYSLIEGEFLSPDLNAYQIVLVDEFAQDQNLRLGNQVGIVTPSGLRRFRLVGLIDRIGPGQQNNGAFGIIPLGTAQDAFDRQDQIDQVDILVDKPNQGSAAVVDDVKNRLQERVGSEYTVLYPASQGRRVAQMLEGYQIGLNFLSGMALFVGAFLIYNAFSMTVVERTREFGFLRTLGMTRRQVTRQVLIEAGVLGLVGSLFGIVFGFLMAYGFSQALAWMIDQEASGIQVAPDLLASSAVIGLGVTLFAAFIPAWQAGRISPLAALQIRGVSRDGWLIRYGWILGITLLALSTYILILNPFSYDVQFRLGSLTVFFLFFGGTLIIPSSVGFWDRMVRPFLQRVYGNSGRLGSSNIQRSKSRTTLTVAALMIGVSMIQVTRGMTDSFRLDLERWIDAYIGGDLFVNASLPMKARVGRHIEAVPGVAKVASIRYFPVNWDGPEEVDSALSFMALDPYTYAQVTSFVFSDSRQNIQTAVAQLADGNSIFISSVLSEKYGLQEGDYMQIRTKRGVREFKIAAVVVDFFNQGQVIQGSWKDMRRYFGFDDASVYLVKVEPGQDVLAVQGNIEKLYGQRDNITVESNLTIIDRALTLLRQSYSLFDVLALIAMLVAALGVINTLTMNVIERTQEIGMLRSIGMTRRQIVRMILAEAGLMGVIGGVFGLSFGILLTRIFLWGMTAMSGYKVAYILPVLAIVIGLVIALVVSQLAALLPARRAARIRILEAIQYE